MKFLVINGPNLNLLGLREPAIYGSRSFAALQDFIRASAADAGVEVDLFQSNHEGAIVDAIQAAYGTADGIVINPAAYTHTSVAILDALKAVASRRWRCTCRTSAPGSLSARSPMPAWRA